MYLWKAWHDHRRRLLLYAAACAALGLIVGMEAFAYYKSSLTWYAEYLALLPGRIIRPGTRQYFRIWTPEFEIYAWRYAILQLQFYLSWAALWAGLAFGATTMGRHLRPGTAEFLFSRPEPRWRAVWSEWGLSVGALLAILLAPVVGVSAALLRMDGRLHEPRVFSIALGSFLVAGVIFGLTQFMTTLTSSAVKGLNFSVAAILIYGMLPTALHEWWHWYTPLRLQDWTFQVFTWFRWSGDVVVFPPLGPFLYWGAIALAFPLLTQLVLRRREV